MLGRIIRLEEKSQNKRLHPNIWTVVSKLHIVAAERTKPDVKYMKEHEIMLPSKSFCLIIFTFPNLAGLFFLFWRETEEGGRDREREKQEPLKGRKKNTLGD